MNKRDHLLNYYLKDDIAKQVIMLLKQSEKNKKGETSVRILDIGDLWRFEVKLTKLRDENNNE